MFGWKRNRPVSLVPFAEAKPQTFNELPCDGVTAHGLPSLAALLKLHARLQAECPDVCVLATLDDLHQACYTSGHGAAAHALDDAENEDDEPVAYPVRLDNLRKQARAVQLGDIAGVLDWETPGDANDPVTINRDPEAALRIGGEKQVIFQFVPAASSADAIAAFPNGYFRSDLNPMQNHVLARHLETRHGLRLFGIGSRFLGFRSTAMLSDDAARAIAADVVALYAHAPDAAAEALAGVIRGKDLMLLRYTES